jgi:hypothetical protein
MTPQRDFSSTHPLSNMSGRNAAEPRAQPKRQRRVRTVFQGVFAASARVAARTRPSLNRLLLARSNLLYQERNCVTQSIEH